MRVLALLGLAGCASPSFTGQAVDHAGAPIADAMVSVVGTLCSARTAASGQFDLSCKNAKGDVTVTVGQVGYVSAAYEATITEPVPYPAGTLTLIGIPDGEGLFLRTAATYSQPTRGFLVKQVVERPQTVSSYCIKREETPENAIPAGELTIFDKSHPGWRIWVVGEDGCIYKKRRLSPGKWEQTFGDKLDPRIRDITREQRLATLELTPGEYFVSEWGSGFLAPDKSIKGTQVHYGGYLLSVQ